MNFKRDRVADLQVNLDNAMLACPQFEVEKVMAELIDNAFKFSAKGTPIQISSHLDQTIYHVTIINQGRGMTHAQIASIGAYIQFERQYYEQQGVGLGLAIAHRLLTLYGGQLLIESVPNQLTALLNPSMNCPHPQPFSPRRREPEALFPLHLGEGEFQNS